jgi:Peptidase family C25
MQMRLTYLFLILTSQLFAQMQVGTDTLYGNEWIDYTKPHVRFRVGTDALCRINEAVLANAGWPLASVQASQIRLYKNGKQVPVYLSFSGTMGATDFIEFVGRKNDAEIDRYLWDIDNRLNTQQSSYTDTSAYFLTYRTAGVGERVVTITNNIINPPVAEPWFWSTAYDANSMVYNKGKESTYVSYSWANHEGFGSSKAKSNIRKIPLPRLYKAGPTSEVDIRCFVDYGYNDLNLSVNDSLIQQISSQEAKTVKVNVVVSSALFTNDEAIIKLDTSSVAPNSFGATGSIKVRYPRIPHANSASWLELESMAGSGDKYFEITNFNVTGGIVLVYNLSTNERLTAVVSGNKVQFMAPAINSSQRFLLINPTLQSNTFSAGKLINFTNLLNTEANYILITHPRIRAQHNGQDQVQAYADYRATAAGGSYKPIVVDITDLYDQYAYGVRFHPHAVRNFLHRWKKQYPDTKHALIVGKSVSLDVTRGGLLKQYDDSLMLVPTIGVPPTDLLFAQGNSGVVEPIMGVGRISVVNGKQVGAYLDKIKQYEQNQVTQGASIMDLAWKKRFLHLNGGGQNEGPLVRSIMSGFESRAKTNLFGAEVFTFESKSADPVLESGVALIQRLLKEGVSLITYMGHAATSTIAIDVGDVKQYPKSGKYPLFAVFGCYSGNCHTTAPGVGEDFVLEPERGAIGYFASVSWGITTSLEQFGLKYYDLAGGSLYGKTQSEIFGAAINDLKNTTSTDMIGFLHQFQYQGDPAIKLNGQPGSDYVVDPVTFRADPNPVSVEEASFNIEFDVVNLGRNQDSLLTLRVLQALPNDSARVIITDTIPAVANRQKLKYNIASPGEKGVGFNRFFVELDPSNLLPELPNPTAESNNALLDGMSKEGTDVYFFSNDAKPIWPRNFSIVSDSKFMLSASTLSGSAPNQTYLLQLDTSSSFTSAIRLDHKVTTNGGLISWSPNIAWLDSTVYYWRIARDTLISSSIPWRTSSFTYIKGSPEGWSQGDHAQFAQNSFETMGISTSSQKLEFADNAAYNIVYVGYRFAGQPLIYPGFDNQQSVRVLGDYQFFLRNTFQGMLVAVTDPVYGKYRENPIGSPTNPSLSRSIEYFHFDTRDSSKRRDAMSFLTDSIRSGEVVSIFMMTSQSDPIGGGFAPEKWAADSLLFGRNLFQVLEAQGAVKVRSLGQIGSYPYGFVYVKDTPDTQPQELIVTGKNKIEQIRINFNSKWNQGNMQSQIIGPAKSWKSAHWSLDANDDPLDETSLEIYQIKEGEPDMLFARLLPNELQTDLSTLDAATYPYLKLKYVALDTVRNTATGLPNWRVLYDGYPEGAITPNTFVYQNKDTLQQGETYSFALGFKNVSVIAFDSVLVQMRVESESGQVQIKNQRVRPLLVSPDSIVARVSFSTLQMIGNQRIVADFNFDNDQPELNKFNNVYVGNFVVAGDRTQPALRVSFDGRQILNGDLVSPKPEIVAEILDENKLIAMTDTSTFMLYLRYPNGQELPIFLNSPDILFIPATTNGSKNKARLEFRPYLTEDGLYTLRVSGRDASGNSSSALDYRIDFQVINKSSLSNLLTYPNPFSTSTCFFYTMTGAEPPAQMLIRVMTVSGRVVREISSAEFGQLQAGTHISDFCWDGKDQFGDQLANGVYYYQVFAKKTNGEAFDLYSNTQTDGFFKNGIGKIVLMR